MQPYPDRDETLARYDALFGSRWKAAFARGLGVSRPAVSEMEGSTLRAAAALIEFFETVPAHRWPEQWSDLAALYQPTPKGVTV